MQLSPDDFEGTVVGPPPHYRQSWLEWFWRALCETANPNTMHTEYLTPAELEKQASFESLDYYKPYPDMYVEYLRESQEGRRYQYTQGDAAAASPMTEMSGGISHEADSGSAGRTRYSVSYPLGSMAESFARLQMDTAERHVTLRWLLHVVIALSVGVVATVVSYAVDILEKYRAEVLYRIMTSQRHRSVGNLQGLLYTVVGSVVLVAIAAGVVVYFEPAASGGGIPDVMAYLNGVHLRKAMNLRTFIAKAISCICAVAGGLPVGLEAPLIHLGAITGAGVTQGRSRTLGFQTSMFQAFRNNKDRRDFITAGAACGVSVAFGAPIGGLLFVMEEVSSFWDQSSNGQIFLATMLCFTFSTIINSIVEGRRLLGWVSNAAAVLFEVNITIPLNLVSIIPSLFLGIIMGSLAAFFTKTNLILIKWRRRVLRPCQFRRLLEPVVIGAVFSTCMYVLSLVSPCAELHDIGTVNETVQQWGTEGGWRLFNNTCTKPKTYSPLGTLNMASGKNTIRHLFSRQTAGEFPVMTLIVYFLIYFASACMASGTSVSGGLVVPSLVLGAVFGRLFGLLMFHIGVAKIPDVPRGYASADAWMDPGVFALIGAGAFLAGTSRMSMAICVIMVELSAELHYLLPVMVAIVMSKTTADWLCEPLYHQMLLMDSVPYLPPNIVKPEFEQLTAADVMASEVVTLRMRERTEVVLAALRDSTHHAFPVVEAVPIDDGAADGDDVKAKSPRRESASAFALRKQDGTKRGSGEASAPPVTPAGAVAPRSATNTSTAASAATHVRYKFVGLVTREDLQVYFTLPQLQEYNESLSTTSPMTTVPLTAKDSDGFGGRLAPCVLAIRHLSWTQWTWQKSRLFFRTSDRYEWVRTHMPDGIPGRTEVGAGNDSFISENRLPPVLDLSLIVNRSPWVIPPFFNLQMTYQTFRMMGLRHMVVVDGDTVAGMITRKDLLVNSLRHRMKELSARLATADSAAPSLPPSYTKHGILGDQVQRSHSEGGRDEVDGGLPTRAGTRANSAAGPREFRDSASTNGRGAVSAWKSPLPNVFASAGGEAPTKPHGSFLQSTEAAGAPATPSASISSPLTTLFGSASSHSTVHGNGGPGFPTASMVAAAAYRTATSSPPHVIAHEPRSEAAAALSWNGSRGVAEADTRDSSVANVFANGHQTPATSPLPADVMSLFN
ncbi:putative chloride channel protein [Leishmania major strain Friedlin]|uniref:Putative chloride channel protein n=1 Tax=Leishmania major TaxID=5664 RepID=Q9NF95_LEIMA|nr:putative chloride channel protein [Leishmania major strain Friedlin]CAC22644.1 putative chloride channel protein [Leishmania major strain Friedlin]CAG9567815.1 chloride_channel_protein_-_putative [Leishmania major strain Friedlin]|eukprot:XP_888611.1 putative chloride channel protein [Leishmania major strain Friedlin]